MQMNDLNNEEFVDKCIQKYKDHESIKIIRENFAENMPFNFSKVNVPDILKSLKNVDPTKSTGNDNIPPKLLKLSATNLAYPLTCIINDMFSDCKFPYMLKQAELSPLHKKSCVLNKANFRPLSILPALSKLSEKSIDFQLKALSNLVFVKTLSAYRPKFSTEQVLLHVTEAIKSSLDKREQTGAVLMDLSRAFDCLPHDLVIAKLNAYNLNRDALILISSYLRGRTQRVKLNNTRSEWSFIKKGVPQGSILGPALFNFFINDLLLLTSDFNIANYADDNTIIASAPTVNTLLERLTKGTKAAIHWFEDNQMQANPAKFQFIIFGNNPENTSLLVDDITILQSEHVKLLGVTLDQKLNFNVHIKNIVRKAAKQLCALRRISNYIPVDARMAIYRSFVLSNLVYCRTVWHFCSKGDSKKLEKLQERGLRIVFGDYSSDYCTLLEKSKCMSLEESRLQALIIEVYKACKGTAPEYMKEMYTIKSTNYNMRTMQLTMYHKRTVGYGLRTFTHLGASLWNKLPNELKEIDTITNFKEHLSKTNLQNLL